MNDPGISVASAVVRPEGFGEMGQTPQLSELFLEPLARSLGGHGQQGLHTEARGQNDDSPWRRKYRHSAHSHKEHEIQQNTYLPYIILTTSEMLPSH
jgi:hypothetical protein